jgi:hypothetical protein
VSLAQAGRQRAAISEGYYRTQLANGLSSNEQLSLDLTTASVVMNGLAAGANFLSASLPSSIATGFPNLGEVAFSPQGSAPRRQH